jgi:hypothetical protein
MTLYHCRPIALATALTYLSIYLATFACVFAVQVGVRAWGATLRAAPAVRTAAVACVGCECVRV